MVSHINMTAAIALTSLLIISSATVLILEPLGYSTRGGTSTIPEEKTTVIRPHNGANNGFLWYGTYDNTNSSPTIGDVSYIEHRNNFRLPASHRLNLGVNFNKKTKHGMRTWNISLYNAYNAMNPAWVY